MTESLRLVACARMVSCGRPLKPGDEFEANTPSEAEDLIALNFARRPQNYLRSDMRSEEHPSTAIEAAQEKRGRGRPKGSYKNRELKADQ